MLWLNHSYWSSDQEGRKEGRSISSGVHVWSCKEETSGLLLNKSQKLGHICRFSSALSQMCTSQVADCLPSQLMLESRIKPSLKLCYPYNGILSLGLNFFCSLAPGEEDLFIYWQESLLIFTLHLKLLSNYPKLFIIFLQCIHCPI